MHYFLVCWEPHAKTKINSFLLVWDIFFREFKSFSSDDFLVEEIYSYIGSFLMAISIIFPKIVTFIKRTSWQFDEMFDAKTILILLNKCSNFSLIYNFIESYL